MGAAIQNVLQPGAFVGFEKAQGSLVKVLPLPGWWLIKQLAVPVSFLRSISWIRSNDTWGTLVGNCVKEKWPYVPGTSNPVDLPSCGGPPLQFSESDRCNVPDFLKDPGDRWPN
ncbi:hypothetical protein TNCV_3392701 [Trichonephila clavipes]|nr:hypothetical protein TNCV_3392701 [Trichonephila clavipes]